MFKVTISQAAKILNLNKITLLRWDDTGLLIPEREEVSRIRVYDKARIEKIAKWFDLRKRHFDHLRKFDPIRKNLNRFIPKFPLNGNDPPGVHKFEEMKKAFADKKEWEVKLDAIEKEYIEFNDFDYGKLEK